jgi:hypothetical protein
MQAEVKEPRSFKSVISHVETVYRDKQAISRFQKALRDQDGQEVKVEEEIRVGITDEKIQIVKMKPSERAQGPQTQQAPSEKTEILKAGEYTRLMSMPPADAVEAIGKEYVLSLYQ